MSGVRERYSWVRLVQPRHGTVQPQHAINHFYQQHLLWLRSGREVPHHVMKQNEELWVASKRHTKACEPVKGPAKWSLGREAVRLDRAFGRAKCGFGRGALARPL